MLLHFMLGEAGPVWAVNLAAAARYPAKVAHLKLHVRNRFISEIRHDR
jgi:hypothetical protein